MSEEEKATHFNKNMFYMTYLVSTQLKIYCFFPHVQLPCRWFAYVVDLDGRHCSSLLRLFSFWVNGLVCYGS